LEELKKNGHVIYKNEKMEVLEDGDMKVFYLILKSPDEGFYKGFYWRIRFEINN